MRHDGIELTDVHHKLAPLVAYWLMLLVQRTTCASCWLKLEEGTCSEALFLHSALTVALVATPGTRDLKYRSLHQRYWSPLDLYGLILRHLKPLLTDALWGIVEEKC